MKIALLLIFCLAFTELHAQVVSSSNPINADRRQIRRTNDLNMDAMYREVKGSPYLFGEMLPATIYQKDGVVNKVDQLNFMLTENEVYINSGGQVIALINERIEKIEVAVTDDLFAVYVPLVYKNEIRYFELISSLNETTALLVLHEKYYSERNSSVEMSSVNDEDDQYRYEYAIILKQNNNFTELKNNNSTLKALFGDDWKSAKESMSGISLDFKADPLAWLQLFEKHAIQ